MLSAIVVEAGLILIVLKYSCIQKVFKSHTSKHINRKGKDGEMLWMVFGSLLVQIWLITLKSFFTPWFCQCFRIYFNKSVCFHRKFIKLINLEAFIEETIIWHCYLDGDLSHTTDIAYFSFPMTSNWPNPQDLFFLLICQHLKMVKMHSWFILTMAKIHFI